MWYIKQQDSNEIPKKITDFEFHTKGEAKKECERIADEYAETWYANVVHLDEGLSIVNFNDGSYTLFQVGGFDYANDEPPGYHYETGQAE